VIHQKFNPNILWPNIWLQTGLNIPFSANLSAQIERVIIKRRKKTGSFKKPVLIQSIGGFF
jgi:hypothetical protein|tara:strand:- start:10121 stop:10303 length:183 start_codon:yes stop_codon:yes gene_type:complete